MYLLFLACVLPSGDGKSAWTDASTGTGADPQAEPVVDPIGSAADTQPDPDALDACPAPPSCITLGEANSRGEIEISLRSTYGGSTVRVRNTGSHDVCADQWFVFLSTGSQDAIAGDQPVTTLSPGGIAYYYYGSWSWDTDIHAWYCIEHNQYTSDGERYSFNGALAPEPLLSLIYRNQDSDLDGVEDHEDWGSNGTVTQEYVWSYLQDNPTVVVGRSPNWINVAPGGTETVAVEVTNLGRQPGLAMVHEVVPAELELVSSDPAPAQTIANADGSTTLVFGVKLDAAIDSTSYNDPAIYDTERLAYVVRARDTCSGRIVGPDIAAEWRDADGADHVSYGQGLVVECCAAR